jgi:DNA-binding Lrp family transcriptional regulator
VRDIELKVLSELMKNSRRSDRELARAMKSSQPTVTRARNKLEREGYIKEYTTIPDWKKIGCDVLVVTFARIDAPTYQKMSQKEGFRDEIRAFLHRNPSIIFATSGTGFGMERMIISIHKNYSEYVKLKSEITRKWGMVVKIESFVVSLEGDDMILPLSPRNFADRLKKQNFKQ